MRGAILVGICLLGVTACGPKTPPAAPAPNLQLRLDSAAALARTGCFDCLVDALHEYEAVRTTPRAPSAIVDVATIGAARTAILLDVRERELGTTDDGYLARAKELLAGRGDLAAPFASALEMVDALPFRISDLHPVSDDASLERQQRLYRNRETWTDRFRLKAADSEFDAYMWLSFACASGEARVIGVSELSASFAPLKSAPLLVYRAANCLSPDTATLTALRDREARWSELEYFLGVNAIVRGKLEEADERLQRAYEWHRKWPAVTQQLGSLALSAEDFPRSLAFYDETLQLVPGQRDAMLGRLKALTYLERHDDAIQTADKILEGRWNRGEAWYWRAWNNMQAGRNDQAWTDVEESWKLLINSDVAKLAGMIAYRRQQLDVAREKFETGYKMNTNDCELDFYTGIVNVEQERWARGVEVFIQTAGCLDRARQSLTEEIAKIQASNAPPERKARQIAKREGQIRTAVRMTATSWFNTAVGYYNLSRKAEAREYAEKVSDDEQFGARAKELLSRLRPQ